jgi:hypothetical protein
MRTLTAVRNPVRKDVLTGAVQEAAVQDAQPPLTTPTLCSSHNVPKLLARRGRHSWEIINKN